MVSIQLIALIVFLFYLIENNLDIVVPYWINFTIPLPSPLTDIVFSYSFEFHYNVATIFLMLAAMFTIYVISSVNVAGSGITDTGTITLKQIISFIAKFLILSTPISFLLSQSSILNEYTFWILLFSLLIYVLNFLIDIGEEKNAS